MSNWVAIGLLLAGTNTAAAASGEAAQWRPHACVAASTCTELYGVPLVIAQRQSMRAALARLGAIPLRVDPAYVREFHLGIAAPWQHDVSIAYDGEDLFSVELEHDAPDGLGDTIAALEARYGRPTSRRGSMAEGQTLRISWQRPDGVVISVVRPEGVSSFDVEYVVTLKQANYDARQDDTPVAPAESATVPSGPIAPAENDEAQTTEAAAETGAESAAEPEVEIIASGGQHVKLELTAPGALFLGERSYEVNGCEHGYDFDRKTLRDFPIPFDVHFIQARDDGSYFVKVAVRDVRSEHEFVFDALRPGKSAEIPVREPVFGGGPPEFVRASLQVEESPLCVRILQVDESPLAIAKRLVAHVPITVEGLELLAAGRTVTFNFDSIAVRDVLEMLGDDSGLHLGQRSESEFVYRRSVQP